MDKLQSDHEAIKNRIREQVVKRQISFTLHAQQEMTNDKVKVAELLGMLQECTMIEDYPDYRRGPCCLVGGLTSAGRYLHAVCSTTLPELVIITVYEPKRPKWETPFQRGKKK